MNHFCHFVGGACGNIYRRARRADYTPLLLCWSTAVFYCTLCALMGRNPIGPSGYCTYTLQALAWRDGQICLSQDYPWLELAIYQGKYFVSFPPVPSVPLYFLTFLFGKNTPDHLLVKLYMLFGLLAIYRMMRDAGYDKASAAGLSLLCSFGSCLLALTLDGAVWYQAQLLAYMLTCLSLLLMLRDHPTPALFLYALAVGCRPFNVLYGLLLYALYIDKARKDGQAWSTLLHRLIPGTLLGLFVAAAYALYNYARFGNPLEFGHNYLPEFSTQGGTQFALWHIPANFKTFVLGLPFSEGMDGWTLNQFGFSFLLASPVFILLLVQCAADLCARRFTLLKGGLVLCFILHLLLLLMHRTFGGYQFGARYTCDMIPYAVLYLCLPGRRRSLRVWEWCLLAAAIGFCVYGTTSMAL